jgi:hypothetical protein
MVPHVQTINGTTCSDNGTTGSDNGTTGSDNGTKGSTMVHRLKLWYQVLN